MDIRTTRLLIIADIDFNLMSTIISGTGSDGSSTFIKFVWIG